jgi:hypothetical protein
VACWCPEYWLSWVLAWCLASAGAQADTLSDFDSVVWVLGSFQSGGCTWLYLSFLVSAADEQIALRVRWRIATVLNVAGCGVKCARNM